jgi:hypothetical protein
MAYQARCDKHRTPAREFRVVNATAAHDFVLLPPFLNAAGQTNIASTAYRDVQRWTCATGICQRICKAHVFDETFGVNSAFNAEVFVAARHMRSRWSSICSGRGGVVIGLRAAGQQKGSGGWIARSRITQSQAGLSFWFF